MLEGEGIDMLSVHARLKEESFCKQAAMEWIARIKEWLRIPVIANGGIFNRPGRQRVSAGSVAPMG